MSKYWYKRKTNNFVTVDIRLWLEQAISPETRRREREFVLRELAKRKVDATYLERTASN